MAIACQLLSAGHRRELAIASAIDPDVIAERGYRTLATGDRDELAALGITVRSHESFPGLLLPIFRVTGEAISIQFKPAKAITIKGRPVKYLSPRLQHNHLDLHPRNNTHIRNISIPLWITEGLKKADSLTSRGCCVIALAGVFNWRMKLGTLGDWEDVPLKGRTVIVCFDADARTNMNVARAMVRLGRWLKSKGAIVRFLIAPNEVDGKRTKGVDDYFAAGGTLEALVAVAGTTEPETETADDTFSDSRLAETIADEVLVDRYLWCKSLGWFGWNGTRWTNVTEETVGEAVRRYALQRFQTAARAHGTHAKEWLSMLSAARQRAVLSLAKGIVEQQTDHFDTDLDVLNTPTGVVDLRTGQLHPHDPGLLLTKITRGAYRPNYNHPDWEQALDALPYELRDWFQLRVGQAITGHPTPDGVILILKGSGENGKSALMTDGIVPALGDYAAPVSPKLIASAKGEHSTERADLRGQRFLVAEELTENRMLDVSAIKQISDVSVIRARRVFRDNLTFTASHSLFITTNYTLSVTETDHGTWRRLVLVVFPLTFRKPGEPLIADTDRPGDPRLKARIRRGEQGQHDAIVTYAVDGARRWYASGFPCLPPTVDEETRNWRRQADQILGFWDEWLRPNSDAWIAKADLLSAFNDWMTNTGNNGWSKEVFHRRFKAHEETLRHNVVERRPRNFQEHASRLPGTPRLGFTSRPGVYVGVQFRKPDDAAENVERNRTRPERSDQEGTFSREAGSKKVLDESDQPDQACCEARPLELRCQLCPRSPTYWRRATERAQ